MDQNLGDQPRKKTKKQERTGPEWSDSEELAAGSELENRRNSLEQKKKKKNKKKT